MPPGGETGETEWHRTRQRGRGRRRRPRSLGARPRSIVGEPAFALAQLERALTPDSDLVALLRTDTVSNTVRALSRTYRRLSSGSASASVLVRQVHIIQFCASSGQTARCVRPAWPVFRQAPRPGHWPRHCREPGGVCARPGGRAVVQRSVQTRHPCSTSGYRITAPASARPRHYPRCWAEAAWRT